MEEAEADGKKLYETSIQLNDIDFKKLAIKYSKIAQNPRDFGFLSILKTYEMYHEPLKEFFIKKYKKKPLQCDNLAFMLLLTYPEKKIIEFTSVKDLKLAFDDLSPESDFESSGFDEGDNLDDNTCVCNKHILYVHRFNNKYTGITINIGSDCNELYGLVSKDNPNYKSTCQKIKEHKEKKKERAEGKPEGFYENERKMKKLKKEEEKEIKIMEKEIKKLNKETGGNVYESNVCVICEKKFIHNKYVCSIRICCKCSKTEDKDIKYNINNNLKNHKLQECLNCDEKSHFIKNDLCKECHKICKINRCKMCPTMFVNELLSNDLYCPPCEENIIKCIDCKKIDVFKDKNVRCYICDYKFINKIITKICEYCDDEFDVNENEKWKTTCSLCYKSNKIIQKCNGCDELFNKMKNETWKKSCTSCYYKNKK